MSTTAETFTSRVVDGALDTIETAALFNGRTPFGFDSNPEIRRVAAYIATGAVGHFINLAIQHGAEEDLQALITKIGAAWDEEAS